VSRIGASGELSVSGGGSGDGGSATATLNVTPITSAMSTPGRTLER